GECSPSYSMTHVYRGVPGRMAQVVPEARLVYVVRDTARRGQRRPDRRRGALLQPRRVQVQSATRGYLSSYQDCYLIEHDQLRSADRGPYGPPEAVMAITRTRTS